jgi:hypothetical protein
MGLNRSEELILEYVQKNPDERHHWIGKVQTLSKSMRDKHDLASALEAELRRYYEERTQSVKTLKLLVERNGITRATMRNLAEYLVQIWGPVAAVRSTKRAT